MPTPERAQSLTYRFEPAPAGAHMDPDRARSLLKSERERVQRELAELRGGAGSDELSNVDQHPADAGTDLFETERDQSLIDRLEGELEAIERAERRLENGTYGQSVESGEPIPDARLEAVPHAERTVEEQSRLEARGRNSSNQR
jgi:DnaK suppressor protein